MTRISALLCMVMVVSLSSLSFQQQPGFDLTGSIARGKGIYMGQCATCHFENGEGVSGVYPPLSGSDYLMADKKRTVQQVLSGSRGPIRVKGVDYDGEMMGFSFSDQQLSDLLNYIRNSWGNKGEVVKPEDVGKFRKKG